MMKLDDKNIEDIESEGIRDIMEEYEMMPLDSMMQGYGTMNIMQNMNMNPYASINPNMAMNMGMYQNPCMNSCQGMNPNIGMNSCMGMYPHMEMYMDMDIKMETNPCMEMTGFEEEMFENGFSHMSRMYEDNQSMYFVDNEELRQQDKYGDSGSFKDEYNNPYRYDEDYNEVDSSVRSIEKFNPEILRSFSKYKIPYTEAKNMLKKIVKLSLMYNKK